VLKLLNVESAYGRSGRSAASASRSRSGRIGTVLGSNGAGKTTILKTISGIIDPRKGTVEFAGENITAKDPAEVVQRGLSHVPEGREVFPLLSVHDNLMMGAYTRRDRDAVGRDLEAVYGYFPILRERSKQEAGLLSGRPAADAQHLARPDGGAADDPARRAQPRPLAAADARDLRDRGAHQPRARHDPAPGRAEREHGAQRRRLRLRAGERPHRHGGHLRAAAREGRHQGVLPRHEAGGARGERRWKKKKTWR
jgi:branched-chain amino acid transport system ATP-binding protein